MLKLPNHIDVNESFENELKKFIYKKNYYEFFKDAFQILHPDENYNDNWHIKYICDILENEVRRITQNKPRKKDYIINVPFRSSKSMITSVLLIPWAWATYPHLKFIYVSFSESLALEHAQLTRNLIETDWYQKLFGGKFKLKHNEAAKGFYVNDHGGFRKSVGTGGQITGSGGDILIVDDGQNPKRAASEKERENLKNFWDYTLYTRLNQLEIGVRINVQQRLHEQDLTGHLLSSNPDQYELVRIPAEITEKAQPVPESLKQYYKNGLFWPTRFSKKVLDNFLMTLKSMQYAGQLQQLPAPEEGNIVKRAWFEIVDPNTITRDINLEPIEFYIDTAETEKQQGDFTAICCGFKQNNCLYILDVVEYKREFHQSCAFIKEYVYKMKYSSSSKVKVEPKSSGKSVVSQLKATTQLNIMELKFKGKMDDKLTRLKSIQPILESRRIYLVDGPYIDKFLDQLCTFPNAEHDDMVDAFVHMVTDMIVVDSFDFMFI